MAAIGNHHEVTRDCFLGLRALNDSNAPLQYLNGGFPRAHMIRQAMPVDERDERLAQDVVVPAVHGMGTAPATRCPSDLQMLTCK